MKMIRRAALLAFAAAALASPVAAAAASRLGVACQTPPPAHCAATGCTPDIFTNLGAATDPKTGRQFFLDYPCDLKPGEKVVFLLSMHGANGTATATISPPWTTRRSTASS